MRITDKNRHMDDQDSMEDRANRNQGKVKRRLMTGRKVVREPERELEMVNAKFRIPKVLIELLNGVVLRGVDEQQTVHLWCDGGVYAVNRDRAMCKAIERFLWHNDPECVDPPDWEIFDHYVDPWDSL